MGLGLKGNNVIVTGGGFITGQTLSVSGGYTMI